jgi:AsmA protein
LQWERTGFLNAFRPVLASNYAMRRLIIILSAVVVAVVVILVVAASLLNVNRFRPRIQAEMEKKLGRTVTLGELHLHLIPFSIKVDGMSIGEAPAFSSQRPFATAKEVYASASLMSLIRGEPQVRDLTLQSPQIELIRNAAGVWNFSTLGSGGASGTSTQPAGQTQQPARQPQQPAAEAPQSGAQTSQSGGQTQLTLDQLKISDGQLGVTDQRAKSPRSVYNHIDLTLSNFAPGKQFDIDAAAHFPGQGKELLSFKGKAGPLATGSAGATPVNGHLTLEQISLAGLNSVAAGTIPPNTDAAVSGTADVSSANEAIACKGSLKLENAVIRGAKASYPIDTQYDLSLNQKTDQIGIPSATVKMGPTTVLLSGTVDSGVTPSNLNVRLRTNNASIKELSRLASLFGAAVNQNDQVKGSISADLTATGSSKAPQVQGTLSSSSIQAQDIVLTNVHANGRMNNGVLELAPVTAGIFGGQENGTMTVDTKPAHPQCSVKMRLTGVDANALLSAVSSAKDTLYGSLAADADVNFAVDASTNLARTLNGVLNFDVTNGRLKNINILSELSRIGKFLNSAPVQAASGTALHKFAGTLNITNGVATTNNAVATLDAGSLSANGSMNLVNQGLNMHMTAVLANTVSKSVGGTGVGGFLDTALANNKGELVLPVLVTGSMSHPTFMPDVQAIAKMKLNHLLPTTGDPSKMATGLLGSVLGGAAGQPGPAAQQPGKKTDQQQDVVNSLLNQFGKKKKK